MSEAIERKLMCRHWIHSHEEDEGSLRVYRPATHKFPPSRGREELDLQPAGEVGGKHPGPDDRGVQQDGAWALEDRTLAVDLPAGTRSWFVVEVTPDKLVLRRNK
ncbi:MAG: hypothetical protein KF688_17910 [Pirellulales bacterium]|nr:hypothetical protein [Pirellulales bacterium]